MYEQFYGLRERPFDLTASPRFLFLTPSHREALSTLHYGIVSRKGVTLLIGDAGTGKTTLLRVVLEQQRAQQLNAVYLSNPTLTRDEFLEALAMGFGLSPRAPGSKTRLIAELEAFLTRLRKSGGSCALVIDEAQSLPHELLEEIRLLSNLETRDEKLLPVVLTAQPEFADRLNDVSLRQFKQRVALRTALMPLDLRETAAYIAKRVRIAGGDSGTVFTQGAVEAIFEASRGIPRTISVVCDNALVTGFALNRRPVDVDVVTDVCRDFDLSEKHARGNGKPASRVAVQAVGPHPVDVRSRQVPGGGPLSPVVEAAPERRDYFSLFTRRRRFSFF